MIIGKHRKEKIRQNITDNLTLCRLQGDLLAVEAAIRDHAPRSAPTDDPNRVRRFINGIINEITNAAKSISVRDLDAEREMAKEAIKSFLATHNEKELALAKNTDELRSYIDKKLFKNDKDGIGRLSFALVFAIDERNQEYRFPRESLEVVSEVLFDDPKRLGKVYALYRNNYEKLQKPFGSDFENGFGLGTSLGGALALSLLPASVTGVVSLISYVVNKRAASEAFANMSPSETSATLAFRLTIIEAAEDIGEKKMKEMIDALLEDIGNIRSDAEYKWYVEGDNIDECRQRIETCDLALARLGKIVGV